MGFCEEENDEDDDEVYDNDNCKLTSNRGGGREKKVLKLEITEKEVVVNSKNNINI